MDESHVAKIYHIVTGCVFNKNVTRSKGLDNDNQFRDTMLKCLWIVELSGRYFVQKLNMNKFSTAKDTILNSQYLALPTIMALKSSHNMRFAEDSKIPGNHVTCWWQEQIIDYESKRTYPFSLENLHITCGDTLEFEGLASDYSLVPRPFMMLARHWLLESEWCVQKEGENRKKKEKKSTIKQYWCWRWKMSQSSRKQNHP